MDCYIGAPFNEKNIVYRMNARYKHQIEENMEHVGHFKKIMSQILEYFLVPSTLGPSIFHIYVYILPLMSHESMESKDIIK